MPTEPVPVGHAGEGEDSQGPARADAPIPSIRLPRTAWILRALKQTLRAELPLVFTRWKAFKRGGWRALPLGGARHQESSAPTDHDAALGAAHGFAQLAERGDLAAESAIRAEDQWLSLIGAALIWAGWPVDKHLLSVPLTVIAASS